MNRSRKQKCWLKNQRNGNSIALRLKKNGIRKREIYTDMNSLPDKSSLYSLIKTKWTHSHLKKKSYKIYCSR